MAGIGQGKFLKFWFPVILYSAIIYSVSGIPRLTLPGPGPTDKIAHILEYVFFGYLLSRAVASMSWQWSKSKLVMIVVFASFLYGLSDEFHQYFVPGRSSSLWDVIADGIGGYLGVYLFLKKAFHKFRA